MTLQAVYRDAVDLIVVGPGLTCTTGPQGYTVLFGASGWFRVSLGVPWHSRGLAGVRPCHIVTKCLPAHFVTPFRDGAVKA